MNTVFADTFYWIAVLNPKDQWHRQALEIKELLGDIKVVTTETVMIELLNYFAEFGKDSRQSTVDSVRTIMTDEKVDFISHTNEIYLEALDFYEKRLDKGYSLTDCISMLIVKSLNVQEILTHDNHFEQEGFTILL
ncbi:MAG: PIN domain-containing protein [Acidobacteriota bacterium]|jgi:predicted nucleic acid-binding protein|nr:PIN domain-containing protein [Acidobacteriota bacterium]